jgi:hypothetical protein
MLCAANGRNDSGAHMLNNLNVYCVSSANAKPQLHPSDELARARCLLDVRSASISWTSQMHAWLLLGDGDGDVGAGAVVMLQQLEAAVQPFLLVH